MKEKYSFQEEIEDNNKRLNEIYDKILGDFEWKYIWIEEEIIKDGLNVIFQNGLKELLFGKELLVLNVWIINIKKRWNLEKKYEI